MKISQKTVILIGLAAVLLTATVCGLVIWGTWKDVRSQKDGYTADGSGDSTDGDTNSKDRSEDGTERDTYLDGFSDLMGLVGGDENQDEAQDGAQDGSQDGAQNGNQNGAHNNNSVTPDMLTILKDPQMYTYEDMKKDIELLPSIYSGLVSVDSLGQTLDGREIYHLVIGDRNANTRIFINGGIHGREYMTSQLVMKQTATFLQHVTAGDSYSGQTYTELLQDTVIHVVPMINPDGVSISQFGMNGILHEEVKNRVREIAALDGSSPEGYYLIRWKSNANGVDINRNFDALWESYAGTGHPSSDHYKGTAIGCEPESAALITLTNQEMFDRTISYHTQGSVIYWYFGQTGALYDETLDFANCISSLTGYPTDANYEYLDPAGYKDWGISKLGIPGLTIEIGRETSPVPVSQFAGIWDQNKYVWEETIRNVKGL